jgi:hypothetical protein
VCRCRAIGLIVLTALGCDAATAPPPTAHPPVAPPARHTALNVPRFVLSGRVLWDGPPPQIPPVTVIRPKPGGGVVTFTRPHPNVPRIEPVTRGVGGAVVTLRGVDLAAARPWDHPPVTVELDDERPMIRQGDTPPDNVGFVRRGDAVTMASRQERFHALRAGGAAFWSLTFPDPGRPRARRFDAEGRVDLTSAAGHYWMHGYLFVSDNPYWTRTAADGRWELTGVPAGEYEVVVWLPPWRVAKVERDPESGGVTRWVMGAGVDRVVRAVAGSAGTPVPDVTVSE